MLLVLLFQTKIPVTDWWVLHSSILQPDYFYYFLALATPTYFDGCLCLGGPRTIKQIFQEFHNFRIIFLIITKINCIFWSWLLLGAMFDGNEPDCSSVVWIIIIMINNNNTRNAFHFDSEWTRHAAWLFFVCGRSDPHLLSRMLPCLFPSTCALWAFNEESVCAPERETLGCVHLSTHAWSIGHYPFLF